MMKSRVSFYIYLTLISVMIYECSAVLTFIVEVPDWFDKIIKEMLTHLPLAWLITVVIAPITEEWLFRGLILRGFLVHYKPQYAILLSALLFGVIHWNFAQGILAFLVGIWLGYVYALRRRLVDVIYIHFLNNGLTMFFTTVYYDGSLESLNRAFEVKQEWISHTFGTFVYYPLIFLILTILIFLFVKQHGKPLHSLSIPSTPTTAQE